MSNYLKYIMFILLLLIIYLIIYLIVKAVLLYLTTTKALSNTLINNIQCGEQQCPPVTSIIKPIPDIISIKEFQIDTLKYCSTIVYAIEKSTLDNTEPIYPVDLKVLQKIYDNISDPMNGVIFSSHNDTVLWIAFRGSQTTDDWKVDFNLNQQSFLKYSNKSRNTQEHFLSSIKIRGVTPHIHKGFVTLYQNIRKQIFDIIKEYDSNKIKIVVTGHSLGAALSTLAGIDLIKNGYKNSIVYNFASPRVGDNYFAELVDDSIKLYRIVNSSDLIPTLPLSVEPNFEIPTKPLMYSHCGKALYFSDNWFSLINNHLMPIYMKGIENM